MVIGTNSRPKKPSENNVAQGFSMRCLGEQMGGKNNLKPRCMNHQEIIRHGYDLRIQKPPTVEWLLCLASFPSASQSYFFLRKEITMALSQWSHLDVMDVMQSLRKNFKMLQQKET